MAAKPGSEAALRRSIAEVRAGTPDYTQMSPDFAAVVRQQLPQMQSLFKSWGEVKSVKYTGPGPQGWDAYDVVFDNATAQFFIDLTPDGKIAAEGVRPTGGQAPAPSAAPEGAAGTSGQHKPTGVPQPGTEAALRRSIAEVRAGTPDYTQMTPEFAAVVRQQLPQLQPLFKSWGEVKSIKFTGAGPPGADTYDVVFDNATASFVISLSPDGKIAGEGVRPPGGPAPPPGVAPEGAPKALPGPYAVSAAPAFGAPGFKTFRPATLDVFPGRDTLPVVVWGNGGCNRDVPGYDGFLTTIASHGFLVISTSAAPEAGTAAQVSAADLKAAIDWAGRENSRHDSPLHGKIEIKRVAVMGQSCGGFLAITLGADPRVSTIGVFNAGMQQGLPNAPAADALKSLHGPVLLINGGDPDFMKGPSKATYQAIDKLPAFYGSRHGVGHAATMFYPGGGEFANVASQWALWQLKQDKKAGALFTGAKCGLCTNTDWDVESKHLPR